MREGGRYKSRAESSEILTFILSGHFIVFIARTIAGTELILSRSVCEILREVRLF